MKNKRRFRPIGISTDSLKIDPWESPRNKELFIRQVREVGKLGFIIDCENSHIKSFISIYHPPHTFLFLIAEKVVQTKIIYFKEKFCDVSQMTS